MSDQSDKHTFALQHILSGIADGLNTAQENLRDVAPYDAFGRPNTVYQLPYLDFELKVTTSSLETNREVPMLKMARIPLHACYFNLRPRQKEGTLSNEVNSTISGRFVAVVPNEGKPQRMLAFTSKSPEKKQGIYKISLEALCKNVLDEVFADVLVEFNFDKQASDRLNISPIENPPEFTKSEERTNPNGIASTSVSIPANEFEKGQTYVIVANAGNLYSSIAIQYEP